MTTKTQLILGSFLALTGIVNSQTATWNGSGATGSANRPGNIGINTTSPSYALDVKTSTYDDGIRISSGTSSSNVGLHLNNTTTSGRHWSMMSMGYGDPWGGAGNLAIYDHNSPAGTLPRVFISGGVGTNAPAGYVGIGTVNPSANLEVYGSQKISTINTGNPAFQIGMGGQPLTISKFKTFGDGSTYIGTFNTPANDFDPSGSILSIGQSVKGNKAFKIADNTNATAPIDYFTVWGNGKTEIKVNSANGTDNAFAIMDANNSNALNFLVTKNGNVNIKVPNSTYVSGGSQVALGVYQNNQTTGGLIGQIVETDYNAAGYQNTVLLVNRDDTKAFSINKKGTSGITENFVTMGNGQTYIGTKKAFGNHADALLSVYGKILTKSLYVNASTAVWADYVFEENYKLMPLNDLEKFYKTNKHLPEIPSAKDVDKDMIDVAKMETLLLKKIEELTLYIVQLEKKVGKIETDNAKK